MISVCGLVVYPIKSCGGVRLNECRIVPGGLAGDRRYMIVDSRGQMVTRRKDKRLATVRVRAQEHAFFLSAPHLADLEVSFDGSEGLDEETLASTVWRDTVPARRHTAGSAWFSSLLGGSTNLVFMPDESLRQVNPALADLGDVVSFADGYPLLLTSESSLFDLNGRLDEPLPMERFRPNVVVSGSQAFDEDTWAHFTLGDLPCTVPKLCDRCVVTTIEETTAIQGKEPLRTLATYRRWDGAVWFGVNVIPKKTGVIRVGDEISITERRTHPRAP